MIYLKETDQGGHVTPLSFILNGMRLITLFIVGSTSSLSTLVMEQGEVEEESQPLSTEGI